MLYQGMSGDFVALLSGGLDSVVASAMALEKGHLRLALTFNYGQHAFEKEKTFAKAFAEKWGSDHNVIDIQQLTASSSCGLTSSLSDVPIGAEVEIHSLEKSAETAAKVWVPNRNGLMMSWAAGIAEKMGIKNIVVGFNQEEAMTFPDNSQEFLNAFNQSLQFSTANGVQVHSPTVGMNKIEIWTQAMQLGLGPQDVWSCYLAGETPCGKCESCQRSKAGYEGALKIIKNCEGAMV